MNDVSDLDKIALSSADSASKSLDTPSNTSAVSSDFIEISSSSDLSSILSVDRRSIGYWMASLSSFNFSFNSSSDFNDSASISVSTPAADPAFCIASRCFSLI
jgi:hypothetical protein